jgi:hypothetical protein
MDRRPIAASAVLALIAFMFASVIGVGVAILLIVALNGASMGGLLVGGIMLVVFATFAVAAIYSLQVPWIWPLAGVAAGFVGLYIWLILAFRDFGD